MENIKKVQISIIILIGIIILTIVALMFVNKNNENRVSEENSTVNILEENIENKESQETNEIEEATIHLHAGEGLQTVSDKIYLVKDRNSYYVVKNILNRFLLYANYLDTTTDELGIVVTEDMNVDEVLKEYRDIGISTLKNMISKSYLNEFNVTDNKLYLMFKNTDAEVNIDYMYVIENPSSNIKTYLIYFTGKESKESSKVIIQTYSQENTFLIYPEEYIEKKGYNNINISNIEKNNHNTYNYVNITGETICKDYLNNYKYRLNNNIEDVYKLLDEEYSKKRFGNFDNFKEYVDNILPTIKTSTISQWKVTDYDTYSEYDCIDQYGRHYIFRETAVMQYTLLLDDYTIETDEYKNEYKNSSDETKVKLNVNKFIKMVNSKDYNHAYELLNTTFRDNNFKSLDEFTSFVKNKMFDINKMNSVELSKNGEYYVCSIELSDYKDESLAKVYMQVIMKLNEGTNFEISFSFK